jgi:DNA ligase-associated metallophosphoesterase
VLELKSEPLDPIAGRAGQQIGICGKSLFADSTGAIYWPAEQALLVADLQLAKASTHTAAGASLPAYDTRETLIRLAESIDRYQPRCVIALGDSLHDAHAAHRIAPDDLERLSILHEDRQWIWVSGNHNAKNAARLGGRAADEIKLGGITLRHRPITGSITPEIAGSMHPAARLSLYGTPIRRPCFVGNGRRLIMPAFGAFTGGLNVLDDAFLPLFGNGGLAVWMLGQEGLYAVATRLLCRD